MVKVLPVTGVFTTNTYFFVDEITKHGFLIDPGAEADKILNYIKENEFIIKKILITHGHFDHIGAAEEVSKTLDIPIYIHEEGKKYIKNPIWNLSFNCGKNIYLEATNYIKHNDLIELEDTCSMTLKAIHVKGHTLDGVVYYNENEGVAFVGDNIFKGSIGISDFYGGNLEELILGIKNKIFTLPENTILYSGHSESTTVYNEKKKLNLL